jgi:hypothetical protein
MKNYFALFIFASAITFSAGSFAGNNREVNEKVIKAFSQTFPLAENVKWQEFTNRYMVHFEEGNIRSIVNYDNDGNFLSAIRYYYAENLPLNILCKIRKKYTDKKIFGVTEITKEDNVEYYIKLEDDQNWTTVKSDSGGLLEIVEKFKKQR